MTDTGSPVFSRSVSPRQFAVCIETLRSKSHGEQLFSGDVLTEARIISEEGPPNLFHEVFLPALPVLAIGATSPEMWGYGSR
jgi:hypothetical protein